MKHSEEEIAAMKLKVEQAQLEVADTIANFAMGGGGSGSGGGDGASSEEVESLRESLDAAQEEIATVSDRCEGLESEMRIMNEKIIIYQQVNTKRSPFINLIIVCLQFMPLKLQDITDSTHRKPMFLSQYFFV